jgi:ABC-type branched-subunit amino acid transport system substrate-binding protein
MGMINNYKLHFSESYCRYFVITFIILFSIFASQNIFPQTLKIGTVLPLFEDSGDPTKKQLGSDILNGIKFAISQHGSSTPKINLIVKDNKRDISLTVNQLTELAEVDSVQCILGPIFSSELSEAADIALVNRIPVISPTATGDDLAESNSYLFQLNPSYKIRGRLMAYYLVKEKDMKNFVVIYEESYGVNFKNPFEKEVKLLNGKILLSESYNKEDKNINGIVLNILNIIKQNDLFINVGNLNITQRKKLENFGVRYSLLDSLAVSKTEVSIFYLLGKNAKKVADTMNIKTYPLKDINSKFIQGYIDAIYIPISNPAEITMVVPELYSNSLSFFIAGTGDWNNESILEDNKMYLKNLMFESEYHLDEGSSGLEELKEALKKTKYKLNKNFLFGYDAAKLLIDIISDGNTTRSKIYNALNKIYSYDAIKSRISLDYNRVNSELNILTYDSGLKKVAAYKINK